MSCFTISPDDQEACQDGFAAEGLEFHVIGEATDEARQIRLIDRDGNISELPGVAWKHQKTDVSDLVIDAKPSAHQPALGLTRRTCASSPKPSVSTRTISGSLASRPGKRHVTGHAGRHADVGGHRRRDAEPRYKRSRQRTHPPREAPHALISCHARRPRGPDLVRCSPARGSRCRSCA